MKRWAVAAANYICACDGTHLIKAGDRYALLELPGVDRPRRLCAACGLARFQFQPALDPDVPQALGEPSGWAPASTLAALQAKRLKQDG